MGRVCKNEWGPGKSPGPIFGRPGHPGFKISGLKAAATAEVTAAVAVSAVSHVVPRFSLAPAHGCPLWSALQTQTLSRTTFATGQKKTLEITRSSLRGGTVLRSLAEGRVHLVRRRIGRKPIRADYMPPKQITHCCSCQRRQNHRYWTIGNKLAKEPSCCRVQETKYCDANERVQNRDRER